MLMRVLTVSVVFVLLLAGCPQHTVPVAELPQPHTEAEWNFESYWQASLAVLRDYHCRSELQDRRRGLIVSQPMVAKQFFEFWRGDAATTYDLIEGSLQEVYLVARVQVTRVDPNHPDYELVVDVQRIRSDMIESRAPGAAGWRGSYQRSRGTGGDRPDEEQHGSMVRLGGDDALADQILVDIEGEAMIRMGRVSVAR
jgi:hypothetical protein